jgi:hypothetical protein
MKICHPLDIEYHRIGSGLILQATCCAPKCGRMYARLIPRKVKAWVVGRELAKADDWADLLTMRRLFDEMRCQADHFCTNCSTGHPLTDCTGAVKV